MLHLHHSLKKNLFFLIAFGLLILGGLFYARFYDSPDSTPQIIELDQKAVSNFLLSEFDPNDLDAKQWQQLGFTTKQTKTILNFKEKLGGFFRSKEDLKKCYVISDDKFRELEPYILLPNTYESNHYNFTKNKPSEYSFAKRKLNVTKSFNPNELNISDWMNIGFTEKQAEAILKYRNLLGGEFTNKQQIKSCFVISEENYSLLEPYLILDEKIIEKNTEKNAKIKNLLRPFDPNVLDEKGWRDLGFSEKQTVVILNYKNRNLKGSFKSLDDIKNCFVISPQKFAELQPYILLKEENIKNSTNLSESSKVPTAKTDFSKVDLNKITFKELLEFGFDAEIAGNLIGFRKKLGGFVQKSQIFETYNIDRSLAEKLVSTALLSSQDVEKYTLADAPESWLKTHPYFKYSADKIIYYRITNPDDKKIWKFIKVKPEYESKMRWYLK